MQPVEEPKRSNRKDNRGGLNGFSLFRSHVRHCMMRVSAPLSAAWRHSVSPPASCFVEQHIPAPTSSNLPTSPDLLPLANKVHVRDLVTKDLKQNCDSSPAFKRRDAAAGAMLVPPDPAERRDEFQAFTDCSVCGRNIHEHSHTCYKPPNGYHGCRMHRPAGDSDGTKPIQLSWSEEKQEAVEEDIEAD
jgi:hypothetical protein